MAALTLLLRVCSHVLEFNKISIKDMDFEGHPTAHFVTVVHKILNQLHIVFGLVIAQEASNHCSKAVPNHFLFPTELLGEFLALQDLLYLRYDEGTGFHLYLRQLREEILKVLRRLLSDSLSRAVTNCFIKPNLMCSGDISTFRKSTSGSHLKLFLHTENSVHYGQSCL